MSDLVPLLNTVLGAAWGSVAFRIAMDWSPKHILERGAFWSFAWRGLVLLVPVAGAVIGVEYTMGWLS